MRATRLPDHPSGAPARRLLVLILLAGLALRLVYALYDPRVGRFEDDRYSLENVHSILSTGTLVPARSYYPSPVFTLPPAILLAAGNALHRASGEERLLALDEAGRAHRAGVLLYRLPMVIYGTLSIWMIFLVGRRLFAPGVGLLAAAMLSFMPWMIHSSVAFKPDALLVLMTLTTFYASLRAVALRRLLPYLLAGLAIALAMSSKLTGGLTALPLIVATLICWRDRRRWALLVAAGVSSAVAFALLNPYWHTYGSGLAGLRRDYAMRAVWDQMTRGQIPGRVLGLVFRETVHGPVIGILALVGLVALGVVAWRRGTALRLRIDLAMMLAFPLAYVAAYTLQTPHFKSNNFLPVLPFTALAAAWLIARLWGQASHLPLLANPYASVLAASALAALLILPATHYVYGSLVPTTQDLLRQLVRKRLVPPAGRSVILEPAAHRGPRWVWEGRIDHHVASIEVDRLAAIPPLELDIADAEVFEEGRLRGDDGAFYRRRMERLPADHVHVLRPRFLELRGPALVALIHRRTLLEAEVGMPLATCEGAPTCFTAQLPPDLVVDERISFEVWLPHELAPPSEPLPSIQLGERTVELIQVDRDRSGRLATTARQIISDPAATTIRFEAARRSEAPIGITLYRWAGGPRNAPSQT